MEKNISHQAGNAKKTPNRADAATIAEARANQFMWISRIFGVFCFFLTGTAALLSLVLLHLTSEAEANTFVVTSPTFSENLAYFEPLHAETPKMDNLAEMFVRQYISVRNSVVSNYREMTIAWGGGGLVDNMSSPAVYGRFAETPEVLRLFNNEVPPPQTTEVDMKRIIKDGWNNWQVFFDTRTLRSPEDPPEISSWIATIQFRYYPSRALMARRLKNPLGFTVVQYNVASQKK